MEANVIIDNNAAPVAAVEQANNVPATISQSQQVEGLVALCRAGGLIARDGHGRLPVTTSREVAKEFGKRHGDVLRAIDAILEQIGKIECPIPKGLPSRTENLLKNKVFGNRFFELCYTKVSTGNEATRYDRYYEMTFAGFSLLVMGFTSKKALQFKMAFIGAFKQLDAELTAVRKKAVLEAAKAECERLAEENRLLEVRDFVAVHYPYCLEDTLRYVTEIHFHYTQMMLSYAKDHPAVIPATIGDELDYLKALAAALGGKVKEMEARQQTAMQVAPKVPERSIYDVPFPHPIDRSLVAPGEPNIFGEHSGRQAVTTSFIVAEKFGKRHDHVIRDIDEIMVQLAEIEHKRNFGFMFPTACYAEMTREVTVGQGAIRQERYYVMNYDGFLLLAVGFTGVKAMQLKIAFVDTFEAVVQELRTLEYEGRLAKKRQNLLAENRQYSSEQQGCYYVSYTLPKSIEIGKAIHAGYTKMMLMGARVGAVKIPDNIAEQLDFLHNYTAAAEAKLVELRQYYFENYGKNLDEELAKREKKMKRLRR